MSTCRLITLYYHTGHPGQALEYYGCFSDMNSSFFRSKLSTIKALIKNGDFRGYAVVETVFDYITKEVTVKVLESTVGELLNVVKINEHAQPKSTQKKKKNDVWGGLHTHNFAVPVPAGQQALPNGTLGVQPLQFVADTGQIAGTVHVDFSLEGDAE